MSGGWVQIPFGIPPVILTTLPPHLSGIPWVPPLKCLPTQGYPPSKHTHSRATEQIQPLKTHKTAVVQSDFKREAC